MAYVTIEDVAQYLADNGYTRWTDLSLQKVLTESGMWNCLQTNYNSAHAIDSRYITFPTVDLSAYATEAAMKSWVQSQGYLTSVPSPDLTGYATQAWVLGRGYLTSHQSLDDYATKQYVGLQISSLASQVWVGNNFVSKATFDELFEKVNIGTEQSPVYAIRAKLGLYSDSFISAGGVGSSGGSGGGGLTWANLAAATTEQINHSHLTTALSGYLTSLGNRPSVALSDGTPLGSNYAIYLPLTSQGGGGFKLVLPTKLSDLTDDLGSSPTHTHSQYLTSLPSHNHDTRYYISNGTIYLGSNSITPITSSNIGSQSVASSKHVKPYATITNKGIGKTVAWVKNWIAEQFGNVGDGVGANVSVSFDALNYWNTTNHVVADANMYTFIKLSGYYSGAVYGQWLLSSYDDCEVGIVGRNESAWGSIHWLATKDWVTDNFQAKASDIRKKNLDGDVKLTVEDIAGMSAVRFTWKDKRDEKVHVGTIAQDWQEKLPEVVSEDKEGHLSMDYASAALVSVINVAKSVSDHERRILDLEAENRRLKTELEQLKV